MVQEHNDVAMLQRKMKDEGVAYRNLSIVSIPDVLNQAKEAQALLLAVKGRYDQGVEVEAEVDKMKSDDPKRPSQKAMDRLKADLNVAKATLDALHPALKPDGFWSYVQGRTARTLMWDAKKNAFTPRLVVSAKAQTIQVLEKRTWRSDKIFGKSDIQVEFRLLAPSGELLDSGLSLATFIQDGEKVQTEKLYEFPRKATMP